MKVAKGSKLEEIRKKLYVKNEYGVEHQDPMARLPKEDVQYLEEQFGIRTDVHRTCISCQARQLIKYQGARDKDGKPRDDKFYIPCKFIAKSLPANARGTLDELVAKGLSRERAMLVLKSTIDPAAWCDLMFGFGASPRSTFATTRRSRFAARPLRLLSGKDVVVVRPSRWL